MLSPKDREKLTVEDLKKLSGLERQIDSRICDWNDEFSPDVKVPVTVSLHNGIVDNLREKYEDAGWNIRFYYNSGKEDSYFELTPKRQT